MKYLNTFSILILLIVLSAFFVSCEDDDKPNSEENLEITEANIMGCWKVDETLRGGVVDENLPENYYMEFKENGKSILFYQDNQHFSSWLVDYDGYLFMIDSKYTVTKLTHNVFNFHLIRENEGEENQIIKYKMSKSTNCPEEVENPNKVTGNFTGLDIDYFDAQDVVIFIDNKGGDNIYIVSIYFKDGINYNISMSVSKENINIDFKIWTLGEDDFDQYLTDSEINYTEENGIITGTFSFTAEDQETGNIVTCTNGQFTIDKSTDRNRGEFARGERKSNTFAKKKSLINLFK